VGLTKFIIEIKRQNFKGEKMIEQTKQMMSEMKWSGCLKTLDQRLHEAGQMGWGHIEAISALVTDEKLYRDNHRISSRIRAASFRTQANLERLDLTAKRSLTRTQINDLMQLQFIKTAPRNVLITGPTGVGKTFLATAIGEYACRQGFTCSFTGISVLIEKWQMARSDGTYLKYRDKLNKVDLVIIDDVGLKRLPSEAVQDFHDLLEERQSKCTLITTQLPLKNWKEIIEDELALDTIVDKLKHGTLHMTIEGESYRKKRGEKSDN
jgi:DNA replication protein DnaC